MTYVPNNDVSQTVFTDTASQILTQFRNDICSPPDTPPGDNFNYGMLAIMSLRRYTL
jgi:hypothetical protein